MAIVHRTEDGYAAVDPYYRGDDYECDECGGAYGMTREEALQAADELRRIADSLITDEQDEAVDGIVVGMQALCCYPTTGPIVIPGFVTIEGGKAPYAVAEIEFKGER